jgi:hypothetical protein
MDIVRSDLLEEAKKYRAHEIYLDRTERADWHAAVEVLKTQGLPHTTDEEISPTARALSVERLNKEKDLSQQERDLLRQEDWD